MKTYTIYETHGLRHLARKIQAIPIMKRSGAVVFIDQIQKKDNLSSEEITE